MEKNTEEAGIACAKYDIYGSIDVPSVGAYGYGCSLGHAGVAEGGRDQTDGYQGHKNIWRRHPVLWYGRACPRLQAALLLDK